jgi:hypothetical protein
MEGHFVGETSWKADSWMAKKTNGNTNKCNTFVIEPQGPLPGIPNPSFNSESVISTIQPHKVLTKNYFNIIPAN